MQWRPCLDAERGRHWHGGGGKEGGRRVDWGVLRPVRLNCHTSWGIAPTLPTASIYFPLVNNNAASAIYYAKSTAYKLSLNPHCNPSG